MMKPYRIPFTTTSVTSIPAKSGKTLTFILDDPVEDKAIVQIYGPRGGLQGTIRLDLSDLREGLLLAGIGTRRENADPPELDPALAGYEHAKRTTFVG